MNAYLDDGLISPHPLWRPKLILSSSNSRIGYRSVGQTPIILDHVRDQKVGHYASFESLSGD